MLRSALLSLAFAWEARASLLAPELTGPYKVGTTVLELVDSSRLDPFAPTPQPRDLVVSLFYPTEFHSGHARNCTLAPQFPKASAAAIDVMFNVTSALAEMLITRSCADSPLSQPDLPLILLGPGLGISRLFYSDMAGELASHGWNVVTVDHPYDSCVVEYPDGRLVALTTPAPADNVTLDQYRDVRVKDLSFILDSLADSSITSRIPGLGVESSGLETNVDGTPKQKLRTDRVGCFGHSFGGAASLQLIHDDKRCVVGADLDGALSGSVVQEGTDTPFMILGRPDHTQDSDPSWAEALSNLRGFKREYHVNGSQHLDFSDIPIWRDQVGDGFPEDISQVLGGINGTRILNINTAFLGALFDRFLKGHGGELLDGKGLKNWPEVYQVT